MKNLGVMCIVAGAIVFIVAIGLRLLNITPLITNPVVGLWRVTIVLLLMAIAIGVNK